MALATEEKLVERFFRTRGAAPSVQDDGFLPDMDGTFAKFACAGTVRIGDVFGAQCVVLLGEPGIGKSTVMDQRREALPVDAVVHDLRWDAADAVLKAPEIAAWQQNQRDLHLVIDSIDEATETNFARMLVGVLRRGPASRLKLELACRAAEWPPVLEEELPRLFGGEQVKYFQIEPLQRKDVVAIAEARGVDALAFLDAVLSSGIGTLASVPMTLRMLLEVFERDRSLPVSQSDIYEKACLELCRARSSTRVPAASDLEPRARLDRASEIAAVCILCRRNHLVESSLAVQDGDLPISELSGAFPALTEGAVRETLRSGLFSARGSGIWGWFHQSFPEYLAARWLSKSAISEVQLRQILVDEQDGIAIVPQLKGLAAWLACLDARAVRLLADVCPERLLSVSSSLVSDEDRASAAARHFQRLALLETREWLNRNESQRLNHPKLSEQIGPYLGDRSANMLVRRRVLHIAGVLGLGALESAICAIALDSSEESAIRVEAIDAVFNLPGDRSAVVERLRHTAEPNCPDDPAEEIRGAVIGHLWPNWLDATELFRLLTRPRNPWGSGRYRDVWYGLEKSLREVDLVPALAWVERHAYPGRPVEFHAVERLSAAICRKALEHVAENPAVRTGLARVANRVLKHAMPLFGDELDEDPKQEPGLRRKRMQILVPAMAVVSEEPKDEAFRMVETHGEAPLVDRLDAEWLLRHWRSAAGNAKVFFAEVIQRLLWKYDDEGLLELILAEVGAARGSPLLGMPRWMDLDSDEARRAKEQHAEVARHDHERADQARRRTEVREGRRAFLLQRALRGGPEDWLEFVLDQASGAHWDKVGLVEAVFRVSTLTADALSHYLDCARCFLANAASLEGWRGRYVAYLSLRLLATTQGDDAVSEYLGDWADAVMSWDVHCLHRELDCGHHRDLVRKVFEFAADDAVAAVRVVLPRKLSHECPPAFLEYLPSDSLIGDVLVEFLNAHTHRAKTRSLLMGLLQVHRKRGLAWARQELTSSALFRVATRIAGAPATRWSGCYGRRGLAARWRALAAMRSDVPRRAEIVAVLAREGRQDSWEIAWGACQREPRIAARVLPAVAGRFERETWGQNLADGQLAALYDWLEVHVPVVRTASDFDEERMFRQHLLGRLIGSGTPEALTLLHGLRERHPDNIALRVAVTQAADLLRERSWQPLAITEFRSFVASPNGRLINSDEQLLDVVVEALGVYQAIMRAETPAVADLWNYKAKQHGKTYWPKDEEDLSDHLARFLRDNLRTVIVNREVEVRPRDADRPGEKPDILVQALCNSNDTRFQVAIEVKGSWHAELETAIETQLRKRYLDNGELRCGIYLVGWFACSHWDDSDHDRRAATRRRDRRVVTSALETSARSLETAGRRVRVVVLDLAMGSPGLC